MSDKRRTGRDQVTVGVVQARNVDLRDDSRSRPQRSRDKAEPFVPPAVQAGSHSKDLIAQAIKGEYRYAMLGLILGLASIVGGVVMGLHGVGGHTSWTA